MAYKNRKHNKRHIKKLRDDPDNWRNRKRRENIKFSTEKTIYEEVEQPISYKKSGLWHKIILFLKSIIKNQKCKRGEIQNS